MTPQDVSNLINIRNYLASTVDNLMIKMSKDEIKSVQKKIAYFDRIILDKSLEISFIYSDVRKEQQWTSTEDVKSVATKVSKVGKIETNEQLIEIMDDQKISKSEKQKNQK